VIRRISKWKCLGQLISLGLVQISRLFSLFPDKKRKKTVDLHTEKGSQKLLVFHDGDEIKGTVTISTTKSIDHIGITIAFIGEIELLYDRGEHKDFITQEHVLSKAGTIPTGKDTIYEFDFPNTKLENDSYNGVNAKLRYFIKLTVQRAYVADIIKEQEFWVVNYGTMPESDNSVRMEVGIEDCLHIEFEYERNKFHLQDVILGKIFFLLVRLKIKYMELCLIRRESTGSAPNLLNENNNISKFEIMDGAPVKGGVIPIRLLLGVFPLTPTYKNVHNKFSVKYSLNMVLVDEEDRRYFKQTDIFLWRERPENLHKYAKDSMKLDYIPNFPEKKKEKKEK